jgi:hypothetical protein
VQNSLKQNFTFDQGQKSKLLHRIFRKSWQIITVILICLLTTWAIIPMIETYPKISKLSMSFKKLLAPQDETQRNPLFYRNGELIAKILDDDLKISNSEIASAHLLSILKFNYTT